MTPKTILIADDDWDLVAILAKRCKHLGLKVMVAHDGMTALSLIDEQTPNLLILDVNMPYGDGLGVCKMLARDKELASIPVIILTGCSDDETVRECQSLGGNYILKGSDVWEQVKPLVHEILEIETSVTSFQEAVGYESQQVTISTSPDPERSADIDFISQPDFLEQEPMVSPTKILIADDDRDLVQVLEIRCRQLGVEVIVAYDAATALNLAREEQPALICLDVNMPSGSGLSVCEMLANDEKLQSIPVIMLTGKSDEETIRRCHSMCAYYVLKSTDIWQRVGPIIRELSGVEQPV